MPHCPRCGVSVEPEHGFCRSCGAPLEPALPGTGQESAKAEPKAARCPGRRGLILTALLALAAAVSVNALLLLIPSRTGREPLTWGSGPDEDAGWSGVRQDGVSPPGQVQARAAIPDAERPFQARVAWPISSTPSVGRDGTVYFGSDDGRLYALWPYGHLKWSFPTGDKVRSTALLGRDGTVYFTSDDGRLYALSADGLKKWEVKVDRTSPSSPVFTRDGDICYGAGRLYLVSLAGRLERKVVVGVGAERVRRSPTVGPDGTIYVVTVNWESHRGALTALAPGLERKWTWRAKGSPLSPTISKSGTLYVSVTGMLGRKRGAVVALQPTGSRKWQYATSDPRSSPVLGYDGTLYVGGADGSLTALRPDGTLKWRKEEIHPASLIVARDGLVIVGTNRGKLVAVRPDGATGWAVKLSARVLNGGLATGNAGMIYVGCENGKLYAVGGGGEVRWVFDSLTR